MICSSLLVVELVECADGVVGLLLVQFAPDPRDGLVRRAVERPPVTENPLATRALRVCLPQSPGGQHSVGPGPSVQPSLLQGILKPLVVESVRESKVVSVAGEDMKVVLRFQDFQLFFGLRLASGPATLPLRLALVHDVHHRVLRLLALTEPWPSESEKGESQHSHTHRRCTSS